MFQSRFNVQLVLRKEKKTKPPFWKVPKSFLICHTDGFLREWNFEEVKITENDKKS